MIVDADPLTQWALRAYLQKWFAVDITDSVDAAVEIIHAVPLDGLILSDELPTPEQSTLERAARQRRARLRVIHTISDTTKPCCPNAFSNVLEKPFELAHLARLLGVPEDEIPNE